MCNDFGNHVPYSAYVEAFSEIKLPLITGGAIPNLEPRDDIWPTDIAPVVRGHAEGSSLRNCAGVLHRDGRKRPR